MQESFAFQTVDAIRPAAGYIGGKKQLGRRLAAIIEQLPHDLYAEPFVGMGGVFFRRTLVPRSEVINDFSGDVATFFRILQRHYAAFMEMLKFQITTRREFERLIATDPRTLTDLERAARFLYLQRLAFGGKVAGRSFGVDTAGGARFNVSRLAGLLEDIHGRLAGVVIENLDWRDFLGRYDRPGALFYLDPPYYGSEGDYGKEAFKQADFTEMATRLHDLQGRFVLSLNDVPEVRAIFNGFRMIDVLLTYTIGSGAAKDVREVIIMDTKEPGVANLG